MNHHLEILECFYKLKNLHFMKFLPKDLTHGECFTIMKLKKEQIKNKKVTFSSLASLLNVSSPSLSRTIKHLEEKGYVIRFTDDIDRRNNYLKVTKEGMKLINNLEKQMSFYCQKIYQHLGVERINIIIESLNQLYDIALSEIEEESKND